MESNAVILSTLPKTWFFDIDGTLFKHNGYKIDNDEILSGVKDFFQKYINPDDYVIITTSRLEEEKSNLEKLLSDNGIRFNIIICNLPFGERILFNDKKPSGLKTAYSFNLERNKGLENISIFYEQNV